MKALYVWQSWEGGTCLERRRVLGRAVRTTLPFDITSYLRSRNRFLASVQHLTFWEYGRRAVQSGAAECRESRGQAFFDTDEELREKLRYYLQNEDSRRAIAAAGRTRALAQYHWRSVLRPALEAIQELVRV
jgi:hypothetical protein